MEDDIKVTLGKGMHEVVRDAQVKARDPFVFVEAVLNLWKEHLGLNGVKVILESLALNLEQEFVSHACNQELFLEEHLIGKDQLQTKYK